MVNAVLVKLTAEAYWYSLFLEGERWSSQDIGIVVIEDENNVLELMEYHLSKEGYKLQ